MQFTLQSVLEYLLRKTSKSNCFETYIGSRATSNVQVSFPRGFQALFFARYILNPGEFYEMRNIISLIVQSNSRGGSRAAATSKMEHFVIIVNSCKPLTIIKKRSVLDVEAALDPPLNSEQEYQAKKTKEVT